MKTCPARLAEIKKQKANRAGPSGMFTLLFYSIYTKYYILGMIHVSTTFQGIRSEEKMKPDQMELS